MESSWWILIGIISPPLLYIILAFNGLVRGRNQATEAWSDIETHLKRRYELIPNLVETVKGYARHEGETLAKLVEARSAAMSRSGGAENHTEAENALSRSLGSIFALAEAYPDLKASRNFVELQRDIADTENKIQASRRFYNSMALTYNNRTSTFPGLIIAGLFNFKKLAYFELEEGEKTQAYMPAKVGF